MTDDNDDIYEKLAKWRDRSVRYYDSDEWYVRCEEEAPDQYEFTPIFKKLALMDIFVANSQSGNTTRTRNSTRKERSYIIAFTPKNNENSLADMVSHLNLNTDYLAMRVGITSKEDPDLNNVITVTKTKHPNKQWRSITTCTTSIPAEVLKAWFKERMGPDATSKYLKKFDLVQIIDSTYSRKGALYKDVLKEAVYVGNPGNPTRRQIRDQMRVRGMPLLQLWVQSSSGPPRNGWTTASWKRFHQELKEMVRPINHAVFRGTHFNWVGKEGKSDKDSILRQSQEFETAFENGTPYVMPRITSWTTSRTIAETFANEAKDQEIVPGLKGGDGFIHIIKKAKGVDVYKQLQKLNLKKMNDGTDELLVAKREKEILLLPGTTLIPVKRRGRVFEWKAK